LSHGCWNDQILGIGIRDLLQSSGDSIDHMKMHWKPYIQAILVREQAKYLLADCKNEKELADSTA
jgi:hypothetical protein